MVGNNLFKKHFNTKKTWIVQKHLLDVSSRGSPPHDFFPAVFAVQGFMEGKELPKTPISLKKRAVPN